VVKQFVFFALVVWWGGLHAHIVHLPADYVITLTKFKYVANIAYRPLISAYKDITSAYRDITIYYLPKDIIPNYQLTRNPRLS